MSEHVPLLIITGPIGAGKTSAAGEVGEQLTNAGVPHAVVDLDALRGCSPHPPGDRFQIDLAMRNLAAVWANFRAAGAPCLIVADVIESREDRDRYRAAIPGATITVVRLAARPETLRARIRRREIGSGLAWHQDRAVELAALMDERAVEDVLVATDGKALQVVAREILTRTRFPA